MAEKVAEQSTSKAKEDTSKRPFGQKEYPTELLRPTFRGVHYKFIILLPTKERRAEDEKPKPVFIDEDLGELRKLFRSDFGGYTELQSATGPLVSGEWVESGTEKIVFNEHMRYEIYSLPSKIAVDYITELKMHLKQYAKDIRKAEQSEIVIERSDVDFVSDPLELRK